MDPSMDPTAVDPAAPAPADAAPADTDPNEAETPVEDAVPGEETEEEKAKKKAAPAPGSTFAEADEPAPTNLAAEPEATLPESEPTTAAPEMSADVAAATETTSEAPVAVSLESAPSTDPSAQHEEIPVAASASDVVVTPPAENRPVSRESATVAITAGADIPGYSAGTNFASNKEVTDAFVKRLHSLSRISSPSGQQYTVASLTASYPEDRTLHAGDVDGNWDKIEKVAGVKAVVAAGACVPLEIRYDIFGVGSTDTPVRDSLPSFTADRGGIQFYSVPLLPAAPYAAGIGLWNVDGTVTKLDGTALTPPNEKPCYPVVCPSPSTSTVQAVSMCLCFDNLTGRVWPELISRHNELALIQHARVTEQFLLGKIKAGGTAVAASGVLGAAREILGQVDKVASALRYRNRIAPDAPLRAIFPFWLRDMVRADIAYQMPGDGLSSTMALADSELNGWFRARNINATWTLESVATAPVPTLGAIADTTAGFPATVEWDIFAEGTFLLLDGGTLDLGVIRDGTNVKNNTYCEFTESFYQVAKIGGDSVHVTSTIMANGQASALADLGA